MLHTGWFSAHGGHEDASQAAGEGNCLYSRSDIESNPSQHPQQSCSGLLRIVQTALQKASRKVPLKVVVISIQGDVLSQEWV